MAKIGDRDQLQRKNKRKKKIVYVSKPSGEKFETKEEAQKDAWEYRKRPKNPLTYNVPSEFSSTNAKNWIRQWYANRQTQIQNNIRESGFSEDQWNKQISNIDKYKWYRSPKSLPYKIKREAGKHDFDDGWINGMTIPEYKLIYFNNPTYPGSSIQIHEGTHSLEPEIQKTIIPRHIKLKERVSPSEYLDDPDEINSRVMEFRYSNKLNPKRKYTIEEIKNMSDYGDGGNSWGVSGRPLELLERYDDNTLLYLINDLAFNQKSSSIPYVKKGKTLIINGVKV